MLSVLLVVQASMACGRLVRGAVRSVLLVGAARGALVRVLSVLLVEAAQNA